MFTSVVSLRHHPQPHVAAVKPLHRNGHVTAVIQQRFGRFGHLVRRDTAAFAEIRQAAKQPHERGGPRYGITGIRLAVHATSPSTDSCHSATQAVTLVADFQLASRPPASLSRKTAPRRALARRDRARIPAHPAAAASGRSRPRRPREHVARPRVRPPVRRRPPWRRAS